MRRAFVKLSFIAIGLLVLVLWRVQTEERTYTLLVSASSAKPKDFESGKKMVFDDTLV